MFAEYQRVTRNVRRSMTIVAFAMACCAFHACEEDPSVPGKEDPSVPGKKKAQGEIVSKSAQAATAPVLALVLLLP